MSKVVLRLGAPALAAAEVVLVQTLCRLYQHDREPFPWVFVQAAPYDVALVDANDARTLQWAQTQGVRAVLRLTALHAPSAPDALARPIRAERLRDALRVLERSLRTAPQSPAAVAAETALEGGPRPAGADAEAERRKAGPATATATATAAATAATRVKLRRWPPAAMLRRDAARVRMAAALSRRAFSAAELATASGQPESDCQLFMHLLQSAGLTHVERPGAPKPPQPGAIEPAQSSSRLRGLISEIRRHLGIGIRQTRELV